MGRKAAEAEGDVYRKYNRISLGGKLIILSLNVEKSSEQRGKKVFCYSVPQGIKAIKLKLRKQSFVLCIICKLIGLY